MGHGLHDLARHNAWATARVPAFCRGLDGPTLEATTPGTYGTITALLRHIVDSEASYLYRLTAAWPAPPWRGNDAVGLDILAERAALLATTWERFLAGDGDHERMGEARDDDDTVFAVAYPASRVPRDRRRRRPDGEHALCNRTGLC